MTYLTSRKLSNFSAYIHMSKCGVSVMLSRAKSSPYSSLSRDIHQAARQGGDMASAMLEAQAKRDATKKLREEGKKLPGLPQKRGAT